MSRGLRITLGALLVAFTGWWLGGFLVTSNADSDVRTYPLDLDGAPWMQASDAAPQSFFRFAFDLPSVPTRAVLWTDADQDVTIYVDGHELGNAYDSQSGGNLVAHPIDVTLALSPGANVVGFDVVDHDDGGAAMVARLVAYVDGSTQVYGGDPAAWSATSDITLVQPLASDPIGAFSTPSFDDAGWREPQTVAPHRTPVTALAPQMLQQPFSGRFIGAANASDDVAAWTTLTLEQRPSDGWIRLGATGPYTLFINGTPVAGGSANPPARASDETGLLSLYHIGSMLGAGSNTIAVHVTARGVAGVYLDGFIDDAGRTIPLATAATWRAGGAPFTATGESADPEQAVSLGTPSSVWPSGVRVATCVSEMAGGHQATFPSTCTASTPSLVDQPVGATAISSVANDSQASPSSLALQLGFALAFLVAWLVCAALCRLLGGVTLQSALGLAALAQLPLLLLMTVLEEISTLSNTAPPGPYVFPVFVALVAVSLVADVVTVLVLGPLGGPLERAVVRLLGLARRTPSRWRPALALGRRHWHVLAICGIAAVATGFLSYGLNYEHIHQDEGTSILVARGMRAHIIPMLPSGFQYWKAELYHAIVAVVGAFTNDSAAPLRAISVAEYGLTILAFGLLLLPVVFPHRKSAHVLITAIFAFAPQEVEWATQIRMYQQAQLLAIVFVALFIRALRTPRTRWIAGSMLALVAMYLSHEETFIFLPAIPIVFFMSQRLRWVRNWRWWVFGGSALALIAIQYTIATVTNPPILGIDPSNAPLIDLHFNDPWWYFREIYFVNTNLPVPVAGNGALTAVSSLAVIGTVMGIIRRQRLRNYLSVMLWVSVASLSFVFSLQHDRYSLVTLPFLFILAGEGAFDLLGLARRAFMRLSSTTRERLYGAVLIRGAVALGVTALIISTTGGLRSWGLSVARLTHTPYARIEYDYAGTAQYLAAHERPGDRIIYILSDTTTAYYLGGPGDYSIPLPEPQLLYYMERSDRIIDTYYGTQVLLTPDDILRLLARPGRIWMLANERSIARLPDATQVVLDEYLKPVTIDATGTLYLRA